MSDFIVYTIPGSPFARSVMAALEEKGLPYRLSPLSGDDLGSAGYRARHPFGRMPAIEHAGFSLYETQAILRYIDRVSPLPPLTPLDVQTAARMDQLMNISDWYLFQGVGNIIGFERIIKPSLLQQPADEDAIEAAMPAAQRVLREISRLLGERTFLVGSEITLADLLVGPQIDLLALTPEWSRLAQPHPNVRDWLDRMQRRPSFVATSTERLMLKDRDQ